MGLPVKYLYGVGGMVIRSIASNPEQFVKNASGELSEFFFMVEKVAIAVGTRARHIATAADELAVAAHRMALAVTEPVQLEEK